MMKADWKCEVRTTLELAILCFAVIGIGMLYFRGCASLDDWPAFVDQPSVEEIGASR